MGKFITLTSSNTAIANPKFAINTDCIVYIVVSDYCSTDVSGTKTRIEYRSDTDKTDPIYITEDFNTVVRLCNGEC